MDPCDACLRSPCCCCSHGAHPDGARANAADHVAPLPCTRAAAPSVTAEGTARRAGDALRRASTAAHSTSALAARAAAAAAAAAGARAALDVPSMAPIECTCSAACRHVACRCEVHMLLRATARPAAALARAAAAAPTPHLEASADRFAPPDDIAACHLRASSLVPRAAPSRVLRAARPLPPSSAAFLARIELFSLTDAWDAVAAARNVAVRGVRRHLPGGTSARHPPYLARLAAEVAVGVLSAATSPSCSPPFASSHTSSLSFSSAADCRYLRRWMTSSHGAVQHLPTEPTLRMPMSA